MLSNVFLVVLFVFDFALIYSIYFYNPSGTINRFLSLLIIPIMLSNLEILLLVTVASSTTIDIALNMALLGGLSFFPLFYHFSFYYPRNVMTDRTRRRVTFVYLETVGLGSALFLAYLNKPEAVSETDVFHILTFFKINPTFFILYILMFIYASWLLTVTISRFLGSYHMNLMTAEKRNILMILAGFIPTSILLIFGYFLFLPLRSGIWVYLGISAFYTIYFIILLLSFGYLDRRAIVRTLFTYPLAIFIVFFLFNFLLADMNEILCSLLGIDISIVLVAEILILIFILLPVFRIFERRLFIGSGNRTGGFHNQLKNSAIDLSGIITLSELNVFLNDLFFEKLKISGFRLLIKSDHSGDFTDIGDGDFSFSGYGELAGKLEGYRQIMNIQQMSLAWHEGNELQTLYDEKIVLIAPLFERQELIGFFLFGEPGLARAWYPSEVEELELFLSGVPVVIARCSTHERAIALEKKQASIEKMAVLSEISSGIAHEIRNPLSIISASAETMAVRDLSSDEVKRFASYIQDETNRMSGLLNRILSVSVKNQTKHQPANIVLVIRRSLDLVSTKLRKKNLMIDFNVDRKSIIAVIDNEVLMQVCLNLILNAIDAMSPGMRLRVSAEYNDSSTVKIIFANQGARIPDDVRGRIFDPFFTTKETGTGLGLSITQRLIREAGGEISLISSEEETVFQILLPAAADSMR
ncbi:MAG: ATP-binding protein [Spirochaetales bacterium]|uniref:histidine kinase n=1 Tax=Candidatus Thalassospirochaeta sargassi TaxID=3119039 RepID=A0AAJ1IBU5_9SPIO|nr:ATP-binding protein [Spirochaetales bacterium]